MSNINPVYVIAAMALALIFYAATKILARNVRLSIERADKRVIQGQFYECERELLRAVWMSRWALQPVLTARLRYRLAKVLLQLGKHRSAREALRQAVSTRYTWNAHDHERKHCIDLAETHRVFEATVGGTQVSASATFLSKPVSGQAVMVDSARPVQGANPIVGVAEINLSQKMGTVGSAVPSQLWTPSSPSIIVPAGGGEDDWVELDAYKRDPVVEQFERQLLERVIDQDHAVRTMAQMFQVYRANLMPAGRPIGTCMALGPTGSGKTRVFEAACEILFGTPAALIKIDCAEFAHSHEIAKLIGSPPGYLGHRETHPLLSQEVLNKNHNDNYKLTFVLFDEIEKASDSLWNLMLGILDKATLTLGNNTRVDFSRCIVGATSNLGGREMTHRAPGFLNSTEASGFVEKVSVESARRKFSPEFFNRFDHLMTFMPLQKSSMSKIVIIELNAIQARVNATGNPFRLLVSEPARDFLVDSGYDVRYGARPLKRVIERELVVPLSSLVSTGQLPPGSTLLADLGAGKDKLSFRRRK